MHRNYDDILNQLIIEYGIDRHHDNFQTYLESIKFINKFMEGKKFRLIGDPTDIRMFQSVLKKTSVEMQCSNQNNDKTSSKADYRLVLIVSYSFDQDELVRLKQLYGDNNVFLLYDTLEQAGICCNTEFYDVLCGVRQLPFGRKTGLFSAENYYEALYRDKKGYKEATSENQRQFYLERIIFDFAFIRDFLSLRKWVQIYCSMKYSNMEQYSSFWHEVEKMLSQMRKCRMNEENIYMYWLDGLGYGEEIGMPYLRRQADKSVYFENAYTVMGTTSCTMKALFLQKAPIEDQSYKIAKVHEQESELLLYLKEKGFEFRYLGDLNLFEDKLYENGITLLMPCTMLYWKVLCAVCNQWERKVFYLIHESAETHWPFLNGMLEDFCKYDIAFTREDICNPLILNQRELGKKYLDEQLEFYDRFLPERSIRIFMSDHGSYPGFQLIGGNTHTNFFVKNWEKQSLVIKKMFSYLHFTQLVKKIIDPIAVQWDEIIDDYALIEELDPYSDFRVRELLKEKRSLALFGGVAIRGVVVDNEQYFLRATGEEEYYIRPSVVNRIDVPECQERIKVLRQMAGETFINVFEEDFFKNTRLIRRVIDAYHMRIGKEEPGIVLLREAVSKIAADKVIAVRGGGEHTIYLLGIIGKYLHRIKYIVDQDISHPELFEGVGFHGQLISPEDMQSKKIDVVILSSLKYLGEMRKEMEQSQKNYQVIDIYEELEKRGIAWEGAFYEGTIIAEDLEGISIV